jgi:citrate lyase beta subunit
MGPKQVSIANEVFGYSQEEIERAAHIKRRFEEESAKGNNGFMDEAYDIFIDEPIYRDALLVLGKTNT